MDLASTSIDFDRVLAISIDPASTSIDPASTSIDPASISIVGSSNFALLRFILEGTSSCHL